MSVYTLAWLVALLPLLGWLFSYIAVAPRRSAQIGMSFCALAAVVAVLLLIYRLLHQADPAYESVITFWEVRPTEGAVFAPTLSPLFGVSVDPLSVTLMAVVAFVSAIVQWHGLTLMRTDVELRRFYQVLAVFTFALLGVVASPNLFQFWVMGEVAAVAAYLLALHWWTSPEVATGARRMFLYLRLGDLALLLAVVVAYIKLGRHASAVPPALGADTSDPFSFRVLEGEWHLAHVGSIPGVGMRTLALLAILLLVAASARAMQLLFHAWLVEAAGAPPAGLALMASLLAGTGVVLLARVHGLFLEVPHLLTAMALIGALTAAAAAVAALMQRDIIRLAVFASVTQLGLVVCAFGLGGYGRPLFGLLVYLLLTPLLVMVISNVVRVYRTQQIDGIRGMWPRMRWSCIGLAVWAAGISGGSLINYSVLATALRNRAATSGHPGTAATILVVAAVLTAMVVTAVCAGRLMAGLFRGEPPRRRGLQPQRVVEAEPRLRRSVAVMCAVTAVVVVGASIPRFGFSRFVFAGDRAEQLDWDPAATAICLAIAVVAGLIAWGMSISTGGQRIAAILSAPRTRATVRL
ncbi:MAG: proton-conducting transporter membrane subunit, partial [Candidatus Dormibacteria bacterium]